MQRRHPPRPDTPTPDGNRPGHPDPAQPCTHAAVLLVACEAGPDVGPAIPIAPGRHVLGRGERAGVRLRDADLEPHHALIDVALDATATLTQLAGRVPVVVDGCPVDGPTPVECGALVELGASRLRLRRATPSPAPIEVSTAPVDGDPPRAALVRRPRSPRPLVARPPLPPHAALHPPGRAPGGAAGAVGVASGLAASAAIAVVLRQPMFVLFAAVGAVVSVSTGVALRVASRRAARSARRTRAAVVADHRVRLEVAVAGVRAEHLAWSSTAATAVGAPRTVRTWERRPAHGDAFVVSLGWGDVLATWAPPSGSGRRDGRQRRLANDVAEDIAGDIADDDIADDVADTWQRARWMVDVPVTMDLGDRDRRCIGIAGPEAPALARSLVVQLAVQTGPADWRLVIATTTGDTAWAAALPHAHHDGDTPCVVDARDPGALAAALASSGALRRRCVVLTDRHDLLTARNGPLRRLLDDDSADPLTVILTVDEPSDVPAACDAVLEVGPRWRARWTPDVTSGDLPRRLHAAGVHEAVAAACARELADLLDPEHVDATAGPPVRVRFAELAGAPCDADAVLAAWRCSGDDPAPVTAIGATAGAVVEVDLVRDGPHALIAGTTGSGKSELLRTLVVGLAARCSPDHLTFVLVDYKGGSTFDACTALPHTVGVVTDLDDGLAARALVSLDAELRRRERLLRTVGADDLTAYRSIAGTAVLPRLVVVVDEFAALAAELPEFLRSLVAIAQRGRSLGMHLVLATQRPSGIVDEHVRANTALRVALKLHDACDSMDVVGDPVAATLPQGCPGRAVVRTSGAPPVVFQAASCTTRVHRPDDPSCATSELAVMVDVIAAAAVRGGYATPHRAWLDPLPAVLEAPPGKGTVGLCDEPASQSQSPLRWDPAANLALVGSLGSGTTTALRSVVAAAADVAPPAELHVYAIDASGPGGLDPLRVLAQCGAVVALHEHERVMRVLGRLSGVVERRRAGERGPHILLAVDGLGALRAALAAAEPVDGATVLDRLLADGPGLGVTVVATLDPATAASVLHRFGQRWVFHLDDAAAGVALGVPAASVPPAIPGRIVVVPGGTAAQLARLDPVPGADTSGVPLAVETLPIRVRRDRLERRSGASGTGASLGPSLAVGRRFDDLSTAVLRVPPGEHLLVVGGPRSGRTSALAMLALAWADAHPTGAIIRDPRDLDASAAPAHRLLVVDDAERFHDDDGRLLRAVEAHDGLTVMAAGRPDALRGGYGTWIACVRRSRLGVVMASGCDVDGDVLGAVVPRRCPIAPRPGLGWIVDGPTVTLAQLAIAEPAPDGDDQLGNMP